MPPNSITCAPDRDALEALEVRKPHNRTEAKPGALTWVTCHMWWKRTRDPKEGGHLRDALPGCLPCLRGWKRRGRFLHLARAYLSKRGTSRAGARGPQGEGPFQFLHTAKGSFHNDLGPPSNQAFEDVSLDVLGHGRAAAMLVPGRHLQLLP